MWMASDSTQYGSTTGMPSVFNGNRALLTFQCRRLVPRGIVSRLQLPARNWSPIMELEPFSMRLPYAVQRADRRCHPH